MMDGYAWGWAYPTNGTYDTYIFITPSLDDPSTLGGSK